MNQSSTKSEIINRSSSLKQYGGIDIFKFLMAICVIAIHTHPLENVKNQYILNVYYTLVACAVSFFFTLSGYFLYASEEESQKFRALKTIKKVTKLYLLWTLIYLPISILSFYCQDTGMIRSLLIFTNGVIFIGENTNSWILWYLMSCIYSLGIIYILLIRFKLSIVIIFLLSIVTFTVTPLLIEFIIVPRFNSDQVITYISVFSNSLCVWARRVAIGFFYISLGLLIAKYKARILVKNTAYLLILLILCILLVLSSVSPFIPKGILTPCCTLCIFLFAWNLELGGAKTHALRQASVVMYFMHMIIFTLYSFIISKSFHEYGFIEFLLVLTACLLISIVVIINRKKSKYLTFIFS